MKHRSSYIKFAYLSHMRRNIRTTEKERGRERCNYTYMVTCIHMHRDFVIVVGDIWVYKHIYIYIYIYIYMYMYMYICTFIYLQISAFFY